MKFLAVCMFALVAQSCAGNLKVKRGVFGSPEADLNAFRSGERNGFNGYPTGPVNQFPLGPGPVTSVPLPPVSLPGPAFNAPQPLNALPEPLPSGPFNQPQGHAPAFNQPQAHAPAFHQPQVHAPEPEIIKTVHTHSVERVRQPYPVNVERTVLRTVPVDRPYPQPITVIKHIPEPYPVHVQREVIRHVPVPQPIEVIKEVIKHVPVDRFVPQPYEVIKQVQVPVERKVSVYVNQQQQHHGQVQNYNGPQPQAAPAIPETSYGVPQFAPAGPAQNGYDYPMPH